MRTVLACTLVFFSLLVTYSSNETVRSFQQQQPTTSFRAIVIRKKKRNLSIMVNSKIKCLVLLLVAVLASYANAVALSIFEQERIVATLPPKQFPCNPNNKDKIICSDGSEVGPRDWHACPGGRRRPRQSRKYCAKGYFQCTNNLCWKPSNGKRKPGFCKTFGGGIKYGRRSCSP